MRKYRRIAGFFLWGLGTFFLSLLVPLLYEIIMECYSARAMFPYLEQAFALGIIGTIISILGATVLVFSKE